MALNRDVFAALGFLAFSIAYGWQATGIEMIPGQEYEPFTPQTFPLALSVIGGLLALAQVAKSLREPPAQSESWARYDWIRVGLLLLSMVLYGASFTWLGFIVSTILFLVAGYVILGERRILVISAASILVTLGFWAIMTKLLGIYLAPGELFRGLIW
jgi:putative tricarboxylic transport membrane protein